MKALEIARRMADLGQTENAVKAYTLAVDEENGPAERLEAAAYILNNGGDYRVSYTVFVQLYNAGYYREEILPIISQAFYAPHARKIRGRYERNCKLLEKYPYIFRHDFPAFDELPISFIPYNDHNCYVPFYADKNMFGTFVNTREPVVSHYFFRDLEHPILADDVFSQYELEYLNDNVRPSEYIGRENHIYLHYTNWSEFCAWLQVLNLRPLLEGKKFVFLIEDEISQYPIDFKERFNIDYSQYPLRPVGIREINKMVWHTQLSTHNGGDFFNEIFDAHPNLLCMPSMMLTNVQEGIANIKKGLAHAGSLQNFIAMSPWDPALSRELYLLRDKTEKDLLVALYLGEKDWNTHVDPASRIAPALFFQPHFKNIVYSLNVDEKDRTVLDAENVEELHKSAFFRDFKYIKTFTPMRRFTTSHGATVRFMYNSAQEQDKTDPDATVKSIVPDAVMQRVLNRSFMRDPGDRLYKDSIIVRLEDGKLNPKATFTALAAFLDLPYTESMTYCSEKGEHDPVGLNEKDAVSFSTKSIYRTYDDYVNDNERQFIEYFLRDAYAFYGYNFHYYDGGDMDAEKIKTLVDGFDTIDRYIRETWKRIYDKLEVSVDGVRIDPAQEAEYQVKIVEDKLRSFHQNRLDSAEIMMHGLRFINRHGQPLQMTPMLQLDPALLENEIYH